MVRENTYISRQRLEEWAIRDIILPFLEKKELFLTAQGDVLPDDCQIKKFIREQLRDTPFYLVHKRQPIKTSFWWRLSLPFFTLFYILAMIFMPLNYLFTGDFFYSDTKEEGVINLLFNVWPCKLFPDSY